MLRRAKVSTRSARSLPVLWIPAVTSIGAAGNLKNFVLWQGGPTGWLYENNAIPQMVTVTEHTAQGPTGLAVHVGPPPLAVQQNPRGRRGNPPHAEPFKLYGAQTVDPFGNVPPPPEPTGLNRLKSGLRTTAGRTPFPGESWDPFGPAGEGWWHQPGRQRIKRSFRTKKGPDVTNGPMFISFASSLRPAGEPPPVMNWIRATYFDAPPTGARMGQPWFQITSLVPPYPGQVANPMLPQGTLVADLGDGDPDPGSFVADLGDGDPDPGSFVADLGDGDLDPLAGCCLVEMDGSYLDEMTGTTIITAGVIQCPGGEAQSSLHGRGIPAVTMAIFTDDAGRRMASIETGDATIVLPVCTDDTPPGGGGGEGECCYDEQRMVLVCPNSQFAEITGLFEQQQSGLRTLSFIDPTDGVEKNGRFMPCTSPPTMQCCYDRATSMLICNDDTELPASLVAPVQTNDGSQVVIVQMQDGQQMTVPLCPETPPGRCCYNVSTGTLSCTNSDLDGREVSLVAMVAQPDGSIIAIVQIAGHNEQMTLPICDDNVPSCCFDTEKMELVNCDDANFNGTKAAIVSSWTATDGTPWAWLSWTGGGGRVPLCPGQTECPPSFCCVNVETMRFVCPGSSNLNGQIANVVDIVTEDGFSWGVLASGHRVPLCGRDCPPPRMCPDCPGCPPGLWMSPDGSCEPPPFCEPPGGGGGGDDDCCEPCLPYPNAPVMIPQRRRTMLPLPMPMSNPTRSNPTRSNPTRSAKLTFEAPYQRASDSGCFTVSFNGIWHRCCPLAGGGSFCAPVTLTSGQPDPFGNVSRPGLRLRVGQKVPFRLTADRKPARGKCIKNYYADGAVVRCCTNMAGKTSCTIIAIDSFNASRRGFVANPETPCCKECAVGNPCSGPQGGCNCGDTAMQTVRVQNPRVFGRSRRRGPR